MNHDASLVVGRAWVVGCSYSSEEILSRDNDTYRELPYLPNKYDSPLPPAPIGYQELIRCAALTFQQEEVEFCRVGPYGFDLLIYMDVGHDTAIDTDDPVVEKLLREQAETFKPHGASWME